MGVGTFREFRGTFREGFASFTQGSTHVLRTFHARFTHVSQRFAHVSLASYFLVTASLRTSIHPQSLPFDFCAFLVLY